MGKLRQERGDLGEEGEEEGGVDPWDVPGTSGVYFLSFACLFLLCLSLSLTGQPHISH